MNFHRLKDGKDIVFSPIGHLVDSSETLKAGFYKMKDNTPMGGPFTPGFQPILEGDKLIKFSSGTINDILKKFETFFSDEVISKYKKLELTHKLGIILHGPPGTGKTALAQLLMIQEVETHGAICLDFTGWNPIGIVQTMSIIRGYQATPVIAFYDEFEDRAADSIMLTLLDGTLSFNNFIFIGCTNYIHEIPDRIKNRKSRIKYNFEIKTLESIVYKEYITKKLPHLEKKVLDKYVYLAAEADLTIDQLKNSIIDYYIDGATIENSIAEAKKIIEPPPEEEED